jgi:hypothetical protein
VWRHNYTLGRGKNVRTFEFEAIRRSQLGSGGTDMKEQSMKADLIVEHVRSKDLRNEITDARGNN